MVLPHSDGYYDCILSNSYCFNDTILHTIYKMDQNTASTSTTNDPYVVGSIAIDVLSNRYDFLIYLLSN